MNDDPLEFSEVTEAMIRAALEATHTSLPARVIRYDGHDKRTATVKPLVMLPTHTGPYLEIPPISGVPIVFPSTVAGSLLFPVNPGDQVLLVFTEVAIGHFLASDGSGPVETDTLSRHDLGNAVAIPGLWPAKAVPENPDVSGVALYSKTGAVVELDALLSIRNQTTTLLAEINRLWSAIGSVRSDLASEFSSMAAALLTTSASDAATSFVDAAAEQSSGQSEISSGKSAIKNLLR